MRFSTTDGRVWDVPDMCTHCQMTSGGQHESHCPMWHGYKTVASLNSKLAEENIKVGIETWPDFDI